MMGRISLFILCSLDSGVKTVPDTGFPWPGRRSRHVSLERMEASVSTPAPALAERSECRLDERFPSKAPR